jgi:hypothetical protein
MPFRSASVVLPLLLAAAPAHAEQAPSFCVEGSETLPNGVCYFEAAEPTQSEDSEATTRGGGTLVLFLHSLVPADSDWQWEQQRLMMRTGMRAGFSVLMPRGRRGIGPGRDQKVLAWPGSPKMQEAFEAAIIAEWTEAKAVVEQRRGQAF